MALECAGFLNGLHQVTYLQLLQRDKFTLFRSLFKFCHLPPTLSDSFYPTVSLSLFLSLCSSLYLSISLSLTHTHTLHLSLTDSLSLSLSRTPSLSHRPTGRSGCSCPQSLAKRVRQRFSRQDSSTYSPLYYIHEIYIVILWSYRSLSLS